MSSVVQGRSEAFAVFSLVMSSYERFLIVLMICETF